MEPRQIKVLGVGDAQCGKKQLFNAFSGKEFYDEPLPLILSRYIFNGTQVEMTSIIAPDCPSWQDEESYYEELQREFFPYINVFLLCFSIENKISLKNLQDKWVKLIREVSPKAKIVVVGNKTDLRTDPIFERNPNNLISTRDGQYISKLMGASAYVECSAKLDDNISYVFETAARAGLRTKGCDDAGRRHCTLMGVTDALFNVMEN